MSIYCTLYEFGVRRFGDEGYVPIIAQGVPSHIDYEGPGWEWLPPPIPEDPDGLAMRAVVLVEQGTGKGTARCPQEYESNLLILTGAEWRRIGFVELMERLEAVLSRKHGSTPVMISIDPDGSRRAFLSPDHK